MFRLIRSSYENGFTKLPDLNRIGNNSVTFQIHTKNRPAAMLYEIAKSMKTTHTYIKIVLLLAAAMFTATSARADTYSWTNLQSDIHGVAQHVDSNLVNPWGIATPSANGPIWVSDN